MYFFKFFKKITDPKLLNGSVCVCVCVCVCVYTHTRMHARTRNIHKYRNAMYVIM